MIPPVIDVMFGIIVFLVVVICILIIVRETIDILNELEESKILKGQEDEIKRFSEKKIDLKTQKTCL